VWERRSADLDDIYRTLYFAVEPQRRHHLQPLCDAISERATPFDFEGWCRLVDTRWTLSPLSSAGSLTAEGGRFNIGQDINESMITPFPALYIAADHATGYREKFQMEEGERVDGLTAEELGLNASFSSYRMRGHLERVINVSRLGNLAGVSRVLKRMQMPEELKELNRKLKLKRGATYMVRTPQQLYDTLQVRNWRQWCMQFDLPAPSQQFAHWAILAGIEGIVYRSSKNRSGLCLAVFPHNLGSDRSFVELADAADPNVQHMRLDMTNADALCGWELLPSSRRPTQ
jgi:hypothetical protein